MPAPPPVPALPDSPRFNAYAVVAPNVGPFNVGFALYGDQTDYGAWLEVWMDGFTLQPVTDWVLTSPSGSLATLARPITDAQITLTSARTGQMYIVGDRRPRRLAQFAEGRGVTARDENQTYTDIIAMLREMWNRFDRTLQAPFPDFLAPLPPAAQRAGLSAIFDASGNLTAGAANASGTISAAMQPVVSAATLQLGRNALGVDYGFGSGIAAHTGYPGLMRVDMPVFGLSGNFGITPGHHLFQFVGVVSCTLSLAASATYFNGFNFSVRAANGPIILQPTGADLFRGQGAGLPYVVQAGATVDVTTNAAGTWDVNPPNQTIIDNPVINGNFELWQRGTTFNNPVDFTRLADRWNVSYNGTTGTSVITKQDLQFLTGSIPGQPLWALRYNQTIAGAGSTFFDISTQIENVNTLAGQKITISAWVFFQIAGNLIIITEQYFGGGGGGSASAFNTSSPIPIPAATWTRVSFTCDLASTNGKTKGVLGDDSINVIFSLPPNAVNDIWITAVKVDAGPVALDYSPRAPGSDRSLGERYFQKSYDVTTNPGSASYQGSFSGRSPAASGPFFVPFRRPMRVPPFIRLYNPQTGALGTWRDTTAGADVGVTAGDIGESGFTVNIVSGGTANNVVRGQWTADAEF